MPALPVVALCQQEASSYLTSPLTPAVAPSTGLSTSNTYSPGGNYTKLQQGEVQLSPRDDMVEAFYIS